MHVKMTLFVYVCLLLQITSVAVEDTLTDSGTIEKINMLYFKQITFLRGNILFYFHD